MQNELAHLLASRHRAGLVADLGDLAEETIRSRTGVSGVALRTTMKAARAVDRDVVVKVIDRMIPDVLGALTPQWTQFCAGREHAAGHDAGAGDAEATAGSEPQADATVGSANHGDNATAETPGHGSVGKVNDFGQFLDARRDTTAEQLLAVSDSWADRVDFPALLTIYRGVRGRAHGLIVPAVPELGRIIQRHADNS
ncbi:DUF6918 family protein [Corynebacterium frankenforstense]|uniref:DUF6918 family protein n=1 Tax=Corynebacterium frankenforstense TaxID=1230998 RepID=UPI00095220ED|nr:hypothetical protein [Corynebacterium frankenforstense]